MSVYNCVHNTALNNFVLQTIIAGCIVTSVLIVSYTYIHTLRTTTVTYRLKFKLN